ncbi:hypothetical protein Acr_14g0010130 [Actinidia rufa]|uniref:Reverse transcriptase/retrotransposon-derived protein RNase H-like domain-containing protein n=1 Tax=Actinidia rufa TaxID=165716 RepID=A0A7J0FTW9_9ERIC|nr:hypothetical protein Acr_14g0010130 [Actinidia rufa]
MFKFSVGHKILKLEEIKNKEYCKYHNSWNHATNNCVVFRNDIQDRIDKGEFSFPNKVKAMGVDNDRFPSGLGINVVSGPFSDDESRAAENHRKETSYWNRLKTEKITLYVKHPSYCQECGHNIITCKSSIRSVVISYHEPSPKPRNQCQDDKGNRISVFDRLGPSKKELQKGIQSLRISAPVRGKPRTVKPPITPPNKWCKVEHPKCRLQRARQRVRRAAEKEEETKTGNLQEDSKQQEFERKPEGKPRAQSPAQKPAGSTKESRLIRDSDKLACNMVFALPESFRANVGQPSSIQGDVEKMGETPEIVQDVAEVKSSTPSIVILKEESEGCNRKSSIVASVIFKRPSADMVKHIRSLHITGHLDGIPVNRLLVDNGSAANLITLFMMSKLGKPEDLIASTASITDFTGVVTNSQCILIMNLKVGQTAFLASANHAEARLYNDEIGPIKIAGLDKNYPMTASPTSIKKDMALRAMIARLTAALLERKLRNLNEEESSALSADVIYEDLPEQDVIQLEELEPAPAKLDDLKAEVQDPLEEVNPGTPENPKLVYVNKLLPKDVKQEFVKLLFEFKVCFVWDYDEMPGLSRHLIEHELPIKEGFMSYKQPPRMMANEVILMAKEEIKRLLKAVLYIDDVVVKSNSYWEHLGELRQAFERIKIGIEVDKKNARAILEAKPSTSKKELQRFLGQLNFLRRFISNLVGRVQVFSELLKLKAKEQFKWEAYHQLLAFEEVKKYLAEPHVLTPPIKNKPLKLYISATEGSIGSLLAHDKEEGKEQTIYYLSRL